MTDITKCEGVKSDGTICPKRKTCRRYLASSGKWNQSWFAETPYNKVLDECTMYIPQETNNE